LGETIILDSPEYKTTREVSLSFKKARSYPKVPLSVPLLVFFSVLFWFMQALVKMEQRVKVRNKHLMY